VEGAGAVKVYCSSLYFLIFLFKPKNNNMKKIFVIMAASLFALSACNNDKKEDKGDKKETATTSGESKQERNKKVIMASMEAFNNNEMDNVFKEAAPGFMDYTDGSMPPQSVDSIKVFFKMLKESIPDYKGENYMYMADGDQVAVFADWGGTFKKDLMGMKASGKMFKYKDVDIFKMNDDGKITEHHSVANFPMVLQNSK
jgi:predicted ester cyclase